MAAKAVGLKAEGIQVSREALPEQDMPAIAWVNNHHFIAVLALQGSGDSGKAIIQRRGANHSSRTSAASVQRRTAIAMTALFTWTMTLAPIAQAQTPSTPATPSGVRILRIAEMAHLFGSGPHTTPVSPNSGSAYPWEGTIGGVNTGNGNKLTQIPIVGWTQRGGLPIAFTLAHNSQSPHNSELGQKWTHSYDLYLVRAPSTGNVTVHWGDDLSYTFANNGSNVFTAPTGIYDSLVYNVDSTYKLTTKSQIKYHFNTTLYCDTVSDENANTVTIAHNAGNYVTTVTDATGRAITLGYDGSNRITSVTDPLSRVWTLAYDASNNLQTVNEPLLAGQAVGTNYHYTFGYDTAHNLTSLTSPGGRATTALYNSFDNSLTWEQDGCGNRTSYNYAAGATIITDARVLCEGFRREYNEERPHQALGYLTPTEFKTKWLQEQTDRLPPQSPTTGD